MKHDDIEQMIYTAASFRKINVGEIARRIGMSPSNLYRKIKQNTLKPWELSDIAKVLGGEYVFYISFPNNSKIGNMDKSAHDSKKQRTEVRVF